MKTRSGFVSNSSSSSFCIYGVCLTGNEVRNAYADIEPNIEESKTTTKDKCSYDICDAVASYCGLEYVWESECDICYLGEYYQNADENQTFGQFKKSVKDKVSKVTNQLPSHIVEELYS